MTIYVTVEMEDLEIRAVDVFADWDEALAYFNRKVEENQLHCWEPESLVLEAPGTLKTAGDDAYSIALLEKELL